MAETYTARAIYYRWSHHGRSPLRPPCSFS